jgi:hypothetical protein
MRNIVKPYSEIIDLYKRYCSTYGKFLHSNQFDTYVKKVNEYFGSELIRVFVMSSSREKVKHVKVL